MKQARIALIVVLVVLGVLAAAVLGMGTLYQSSAENAADYYSRIDNSLAAPINPHGGMNYRYTLQAYRADGQGKSLELDTSRILKDGAFIKIQVAPMRGVIGWEEMQYEQLPPAVQDRYTP